MAEDIVVHLNHWLFLIDVHDDDDGVYGWTNDADGDVTVNDVHVLCDTWPCLSPSCGAVLAFPQNLMNFRSSSHPNPYNLVAIQLAVISIHDCHLPPPLLDKDCC